MVSILSINVGRMIPSLDLTLILRPEAPLPAMPFMGSMLRGAFGHALRQTSCVMKGRPCDGCLLEYSCVYTSIFETRPPQGTDLMRKYNRAPHPYVLSVPMHQGAREPGQAIEMTVRLFGHAIRQAPFVLHAFSQAAKTGLGERRIPHQLDEVRDRAGQTVWEAGKPFPVPAPDGPPPVLDGQRFALRFLSPLRLKKDDRLVTPDTLTAPALLMALVRRWGLMSGFFDPEPVSFDFREAVDRAERARLTALDLTWLDLHRKSNRQKALLGTGGVTGSARLDLSADDAAFFAPILSWASRLHIGKGATMGLGNIAVESQIA